MEIPLLPIAALADGEMAGLRVQGHDVLVCHVDGQYYAVENRCSHAQQPLHTGRLEGFTLTCPMHRAAFDVRSGMCLRAPATTALRRFPVILAGGKVCLTL